MNCVRLLRLAERQNLKVFQTAWVRYASQHPVRFMETQDMWREKDGLSRRWQLIYKGPMDTGLKFANIYLTATTAIVSASSLYYYAFVFDKADLNQPVVIGDDVVIANSPVECLVYLGAFIALHIAVKVLISKYVYRIYKNGDEYVAIFRTVITNSIKQHKFHLKDFKKLSPTFVVSWGDARFDIGNKHAIILENYFKTPELFNNLLNNKKADDE